ncbi:MAG TPA: lyase family protein, partial [Myxococcota bacterium]
MTTATTTATTATTTATTTAPTRLEHDSLGDIAVAADKLWGAQTQRSLQNFRIGRELGDVFPRPLIRALALVKRASAEANAALGGLEPKRAAAIVSAADEIIAGRLDDQFPLVIWQTGSGTQTNMNVNEVIANRASELLGGSRGRARLVHENDDVNKSQSSNDAFPTAMHIAALAEIEQRLLPAVRALSATLADKARAFADVVKIGRTHLQDAVPLTLGQELSGWAAQLDDAVDHIAATSSSWLLPLPLGGTAVGTGLNASPGFAAAAIANIA